MNIKSWVERLRTLSLPLKVLIVLAVPVGILLIGAAAVLSILVFLFLWCLVLACYAAALSLAAGAIAGVFGGIFALFSQPPVQAVFLIGCGIFCAGVLIFWYRACFGMTNFALRICRRTGEAMDRLYGRKAGSNEGQTD